MLITNNEEALRVKCESVTESEVGSIISTLETQLNIINANGDNGIGLAAPQIGIAKSAAIIRFDKYKLNLVNCKIDKMYDSQIFRDEGCLSFPGRVENTNRFQEVVVINNLDQMKSFIATGFLAVAVQHELDHINQTLFIDKVVKQKKAKPNDPCICGSSVKYKKCCGK